MEPPNSQNMMERDERPARVAEWKRLTEQVLPALAKQHRWPLRLDHCFKRVCLDFAFGDAWFRHLPRPAERNIGEELLQRAIKCAQDIEREGAPILRLRNEESLRYRGKGKYAAPEP